LKKDDSRSMRRAVVVAGGFLVDPLLVASMIWRKKRRTRCSG
jgi:hypothetical protein